MSVQKNIYLGPYVEVKIGVINGKNVLDTDFMGITDEYLCSNRCMEEAQVERDGRHRFRRYALMPNKLEPEPPREFDINDLDSGVYDMSEGYDASKECSWLNKHYIIPIMKLVHVYGNANVETRWGLVVWFS